MLEFLRSFVLLQETQHTQGNQGTQEDQDAQEIQENQGNQQFRTGNQLLVKVVLYLINQHTRRPCRKYAAQHHGCDKEV